jgi:hypothetical protein
VGAGRVLVPHVVGDELLAELLRVRLAAALPVREMVVLAGRVHAVGVRADEGALEADPRPVSGFGAVDAQEIVLQRAQTDEAAQMLSLTMPSHAQLLTPCPHQSRLQRS